MNVIYMIKVWSKVFYFSDMISGGGGGEEEEEEEESIVSRIRCSWNKFRELLSLITGVFTVHGKFSRHVSGMLFYMIVSPGQ